MWPIQRGSRRKAALPQSTSAHLSQVAHSARAHAKEPSKVAYSAWGGHQFKIDGEGRAVKHWFSAKRDKLFALNWPLLPGVAYNRPHWIRLGCATHSSASFTPERRIPHQTQAADRSSDEAQIIGETP
jgi:hypothetical protein